MIALSGSYDATSGGTELNQVELQYNGLGMLAKDSQEHEEAKDGDTLYVEYDYDETASGGAFARALRPEWVRYPNGRKVFFDYGAGDEPVNVSHFLNRLLRIRDDDNGSAGGTLAEYSYLGLGAIVIEDFQQPDVKLDYQTSGSYAGLDAFGRVAAQLWRYGSVTVCDGDWSNPGTSSAKASPHLYTGRWLDAETGL